MVQPQPQATMNNGLMENDAYLHQSEAAILEAIQLRGGGPMNSATVGQVLLNKGLSYRTRGYPTLSALLNAIEMRGGKFRAFRVGTVLMVAPIPHVPSASTPPVMLPRASVVPTPRDVSYKPAIRTQIPTQLWEATIYPPGPNEKRFVHKEFGDVKRTSTGVVPEPAGDYVLLEPMPQEAMIKSAQNFLAEYGLNPADFDQAMVGDRWFASFTSALQAVRPMLRVPWAKRRWEMVHSYLTDWAKANNLDPERLLSPTPPQALLAATSPTHEATASAVTPVSPPGTSGDVDQAIKQFVREVLRSSSFTEREKLVALVAAAKLKI